MQSAIAYVRVSTGRQGRSGLGLAAQQAAIARFAETEGFEMIQTFTEVETGKGADSLNRRPQLAAALKLGQETQQAINSNKGAAGGWLHAASAVLGIEKIVYRQTSFAPAQ